MACFCLIPGKDMVPKSQGQMEEIKAGEFPLLDS